MEKTVGAAQRASSVVQLPLSIQYLRQLRKAEGGLRGMNTAQTGDPVENLGQ